MPVSGPPVSGGVFKPDLFLGFAMAMLLTTARPICAFAQDETNAESPAAATPVDSPAASTAPEPAASPDSAAAADAHDADHKSSKGRTYLDTIVVTPQQRVQTLLEVPMSVTAIRGETLEKMGASGATDIAMATPSFSAIEEAPGHQTYTMRGISSLAAGTRSTVGFYLDDVSLTALPGFEPDVDLFDIQRVEVLKGPQGTLYGEGSMGGTLKLQTNAPDFSGFSVTGRGTYFPTERGDPSAEFNGAFNLPIADAFGARLVVSSVHDGGFIDQTALGVNNANYVAKKNARLRMDWRPTYGWSVESLVIHEDSASGSENYADEKFKRADHTPPGSKDVINVYNLKASPELGWANLLVSYAYSDRKGHFVTDGREVAGNIARASGFPTLDDQLQMLALAGVDEIRSDAGIVSTTQIGELRLSSTADGPLQWVGGLYWRKADEDSVVLLAARQDRQQVATLGDYNQLITGTQTAAFGQAEYSLTQRLSVTAGLRYFHDVGASDLHGTIQAQDATNYDPYEFKDYEPRVVLSMRGPDHWLGFADSIMAYASVAKGFRSGGANVRPTGPDPQAVFGPDHVWTYEIGGKAALWDGLLTAESAVFYNDWRDVQVTTRNSSNNVRVTNAGVSKGLGIDWNFVSQPLDGLSLTFSGDVIDAKFVTSTAEKHPGDPMDFLPPWSVSLGAEYDFNWTRSVMGLLRVDYNYQAENRFVSRSAGFDTISDPINMMAARVGFERGGLHFALFGRNLTNFDGKVTDFGPGLLLRSRPPNFGVEMKAQF